MKNATTAVGLMVACMVLGTSAIRAQDWPQWRGPNRDAKATGFTAPKTWPKELTQKWKVTVGDGVSTPALVGDKLYVFTRQGGDEIVRCLKVADGMEVWQEKYASASFTGADSGFQGPRSSPAVAGGKVVTLGADGILSCFDAASGKRLWHKDDLKGKPNVPQFHVASSPMILDGLAIVQLGGGSGGIMAFDLATGTEKWKWTGDGPAYASPVLMSLGSEKAVVAETAGNVVAVGAADGKLLWKTAFAAQRMQYNAATPMVEGQTIIYAGNGRGTRAVKIEKKGEEIAETELWKTSENTVKFNTPVVKSARVYGVTEGEKLFCINAETGKTAWTADIPSAGGRQRGYASVVDAGPVLMVLNPTGQLIVFEPSDKEFKELAKYKVGMETYAYPIASGNRVIVKDKDSVALFTIE
jgi:outer membrane protein assembly factor BamB